MDKTRRFNLLVSEIDAIYHEAALHFGLSDSAMMILYVISTHGDSCMLGDVIVGGGMSKQTANSALRKLEAEGIVRLEAAGAKKKRICLTGEGKALASRTAAELIRLENEVFGAWTDEEWAAYFSLTERYIREMKRKVKEMDE